MAMNMKQKIMKNGMENFVGDNINKIFIMLDREIKQGQFVLIFGFKEVDLDVINIQDLIKADLVEVVE